MKNTDKIFELLDSIGKAYATELISLIGVRPDVISILEEDIQQDLENILNKIRFYTKTGTNQQLK